MSGLASYHSGLAAEANVAHRLAQNGHRILCQRYKTPYGEIDVISEKDGVVQFTEVKSAKSHEVAASRITENTQRRVYDAAAQYLATNARMECAETRFLAALQDQFGRIQLTDMIFD